MKMKILTIAITLFMVSSNFVVSAGIKDNTKRIQRLLSEKYGNEIYYSYDQLTDLLDELQQEYPKIFNYSSLGKTWEGRDIWLVKISDNVSIDEKEPGVLYTGGQHGDEKQGYQVVIYTIKSIVENYTLVNVNQSFTERIRNVVNNTQLFFIPMVNPDGVEAVTRKNGRPNDCLLGKTLLRGVDTNRNSGYKWELIDQYPIRYRFKFPYLEKQNVKYPIFDFSSTRGEGQYRGPYPFSEPESRAIKSVVENQSIAIYVDYHAAVNGIYYGWAWNHDQPIENESLLLSIAQGVSNIGGYNVHKGSVTYVLGGMRDWISSQGILAFTIELPYTRGDRPLLHIMHQNGNILPWKNIPIFEVCETNVLVNLYFAERAMAMD